MKRAPDRIETARLVLSRPTANDTAEVFHRYASDAEVVRYLSFPRHQSIADTEIFMAISDREWTESPAGPFVIRSRANGSLLGATGLSFETPFRAMTGYVLAKEQWG